MVDKRLDGWKCRRVREEVKLREKDLNDVTRSCVGRDCLFGRRSDEDWKKAQRRFNNRFRRRWWVRLEE